MPYSPNDTLTTQVSPPSPDGKEPPLKQSPFLSLPPILPRHPGRPQAAPNKRGKSFPLKIHPKVYRHLRENGFSAKEAMPYAARVPKGKELEMELQRYFPNAFLFERVMHLMTKKNQKAHFDSKTGEWTEHEYGTDTDAVKSSLEMVLKMKGYLKDSVVGVNMQMNVFAKLSDDELMEIAKGADPKEFIDVESRPVNTSPNA